MSAKSFSCELTYSQVVGITCGHLGGEALFCLLTRTITDKLAKAGDIFWEGVHPWLTEP